MKSRMILTLISVGIITASVGGSLVFAQSTTYTKNKKVVKKKVISKKAVQKKALPKKVVSTPVHQSEPSLSKADRAELQSALNLAKNGNYQDASIKLFNLSRSPRFERERMQIKYLLGLMLFDMKMYQTAAFQFVDVVRDGNSNYIKKSLEKLSLSADKLGDVTLLNYALSKVHLEDFPSEDQDMLRYRIGEYQMRNGEFAKAAANFGAVDASSSLILKAKYQEGLAYASQGKNEMALRAFQELLDMREAAPVTDTARVDALLGLARTHYQNKEWEDAIGYYRQIPRDTDQWHESLFEISWAQFRAAQFRSVLGNMQSLHSPYYEDFYLPETLLLRSLVYLYICQFDEMSKTLDLFEHVYLPIRKDLVRIIKTYRDPEKYYREIEKVADNFNRYKKDVKARKESDVPFIIARKILKESDFAKSYEYIRVLNMEKKLGENMGMRWRTAPIGVYTRNVLATRLQRARESAGLLAKKYVIDTHRDLLELFKQHDFARFEMLSGKKEQVRKELVSDNKPGQIEDDQDRSFYIQNGYQYWPFQGEYWLDEIGNYYYLGKSRCE